MNASNTFLSPEPQTCMNKYLVNSFTKIPAHPLMCATNNLVSLWFYFVPINGTSAHPGAQAKNFRTSDSSPSGPQHLIR